MEEQKLAERLRKHSRSALEQAIRRYTPYVSTVVWRVLSSGGTAPREDVEEVVSDVFLAAWNQSSDLESGHVKSWLGAVARHKAKNKLRQMGKALPLEESMLDIPSLEDPTEGLDRREEAALVRRAVDAMPPREREVFLRHYYYAQSIKEIAAAMAMNESTVKNQLRRGRIKLKEQLLKEGSLYEA